MHVDIDQQSLYVGLQHIAAALPVRAITPILTGVYIHSGQEGMTLTSCNLAVTMQYFIPCGSDSLNVHQEGCVVIPARFLIDIIRNLSGGMVSLQAMHNQFIRISAGHSVYRLAGMNSEDFPAMKATVVKSGFSLSNAEFKKMVKQVSFAASTTETKPILTGVSLQTDDQMLTFSATDGIRLATKTAKFETDFVSGFRSVVIPAKHLSDYTKMLTDKWDSTQITLRDHHIHFQTRNFSMQSLLIPGTFPSIERLIPKSFSTEITMDTSLLLRAVHRASLLASNTYVIGLRITSTEAELFATAAEVGDVSEKIAIQTYLGEPLTLFFNGKYLKDILIAIESEQIRLCLWGREKPFVIQPSHSPDPLYIITPVRTAYKDSN